MNIKITIINGSIRNGGNTDRLLSELEKGISQTEVNYKKFVLRNSNISGCKGCYYCYKHNKCSIKDDMQEIHSELQSSDLLIFATPLYWWGVTGLLKTFIDRLYLYYPKNNADLIKGKNLILLIPMHVNKNEHGEQAFLSETEPIIKTSNYIFKRLGINILDIIFYEGLNSKNDLLTKTEYLNDTFILGKNLANI